MAMSPAAAGSPTRSSWGAQAVALVLAALATNEVEGEEGELVDALNRLLGWLDPVWTACYGAAGMVCLALLVAVLAVRRLALARDIVLSAAVALGASEVLARVVDDAAPSVGDMLWRVGDPSFRRRGWRSSARWRWWRRRSSPGPRAMAPPHNCWRELGGSSAAQRRFVPRCGR